MADERGLTEEETEICSSSVSTTVVVTTSETPVAESGVREDILQQAFDGTDEFEQECVAYTVETDDPSSEQDTSKLSTKSGFKSNSCDAHSCGDIAFSESFIAHTAEENVRANRVETDLVSNCHVLGTEQLLPVVENRHPLGLLETDQTVNQQPEGSNGQQHAVHYSVLESNHSGAPLGSSQNPIRIIQQGNQYTPVQQLTTEQLQQIMQVVQQQQLARNTQESGGSVLVNPNTNTRIVYRVIYPSELHKGQQTVFHVAPSTTSATSGSGHQVVVTKRHCRKKGKDEEEDKLDGPEMSREEKEERKKHRPRTRSGRVSKPPRHMVKDYKHIHVLDWDEDYDDSDGGYSDYKGSDEEGHGRSRDKSELYSGLSAGSRPKNYKCEICDKSYIGQAGLYRHYRLNPTHVIVPANASDIADKRIGVRPRNLANSDNTNGSSSVSMVPGPEGMFTVISNMGSSIDNLSEDSNTQDSIPSSSSAVSPITSPATRRGRCRGGLQGKGRWSYYHLTASARKKQKLKELVKTVEDEDLMEVVLPKLVKFVSLWEFMLMKLETYNGAHPRVDHIYHEYLTLHKQVKQVCHEGLKLKDEGQQENSLRKESNLDEPSNTLNLDDESVAKSLGLTVGTYELVDLPARENTSFCYKYLTSDLSLAPGVSLEKRTVQVVTPEELVCEPPNKRSRSTPLLASSDGLPGLTAPGSSLLTSSVINTSLNNSEVNKQNVPENMIHTKQPQSSKPSDSFKPNMAVIQVHQEVLDVRTAQLIPGSECITFVNNMKTVTPDVAAKTMVVSSGTQLTPARPAVVSLLNNATSCSSAQTLHVKTRHIQSVAKSTDQVAASTSLADHHVMFAASSSADFLDNDVCEAPRSQISNSLSMPSFLPQVSCATLDTAAEKLTESASNMDTSVMPVSRVSSSFTNGNIKADTLLGSAGASDIKVAGAMKENSLSDTCTSVVFTGAHSQSDESSFLKYENGDEYSLVDTSEPLSLTSVSDTFETDVATSGATRHIGEHVLDNQIKNGPEREVLVHCGLSTRQPESLLLDQNNIEMRTAGTEENAEAHSFTLHHNATLFQTEAGTVVLQNPDGTTFQLQGVGDQALTLQSVQEMLGQMLSGENVQVNVQH